MPTEYCRECNSLVQTDAKKCEHCGVEYPTILPEKITDLMYSYKNSEITKNEYNLYRINPTHIFVRCSKNFCQEKYKVIKISKSKLDKQVCSGCGNKFEYVSQKQAKQYFDGLKSNVTERKTTLNYENLGKSTKSFIKNSKDKTQNIFLIVMIFLIFILLVHYCGDTSDGPPRFFNDVR